MMPSNIAVEVYTKTEICCDCLSFFDFSSYSLFFLRVAVGSASDSLSVDACLSAVRAPSKAPAVSLSKKLYRHFLVLVGSTNALERDLHKQKLLVSQTN